MTIERCANGWPALHPSSPLLHKWVFPPRVDRAFLLRNGSVGFLLMYWAELYHDKVDRFDVGTVDDWAYNFRVIAGTRTLSNHCGYAIDLDATKHPQHVGVPRTFTTEQVDTIHHLLHRRLFGVIAWGGDWSPTFVDGMHYEVVAPLDRCEQIARQLMDSRRGQRLLTLNAGQQAVILS